MPLQNKAGDKPPAQLPASCYSLRPCLQQPSGHLSPIHPDNFKSAICGVPQRLKIVLLF